MSSNIQSSVDTRREGERWKMAQGTTLKMENQFNSIGECKSKWPFGLICNGITFYKVERSRERERERERQLRHSLKTASFAFFEFWLLSFSLYVWVFLVKVEEARDEEREGEKERKGIHDICRRQQLEGGWIKKAIRIQTND